MLPHIFRSLPLCPGVHQPLADSEVLSGCCKPGFTACLVAAGRGRKTIQTCWWTRTSGLNCEQSCDRTDVTRPTFSKPLFMFTVIIGDEWKSSGRTSVRLLENKNESWLTGKRPPSPRRSGFPQVPSWSLRNGSWATSLLALVCVWDVLYSHSWCVSVLQTLQCCWTGLSYFQSLHWFKSMFRAAVLSFLVSPFSTAARRCLDEGFHFRIRDKRRVTSLDTTWI